MPVLKLVKCGLQWTDEASKIEEKVVTNVFKNKPTKIIVLVRAIFKTKKKLIKEGATTAWQNIPLLNHWRKKNFYSVGQP